MEILDGGGEPSAPPPEPFRRQGPAVRDGADGGGTVPATRSAKAPGGRPDPALEVDLDVPGPVRSTAQPGPRDPAAIGTGTGVMGEVMGPGAGPVGPGAVPDTVGGPVRRLLGPVLAPEASALAALVIDLIALAGGNVLAYLLLGADSGNLGPAAQVERLASGLAMLTVPAAALSVLALFRTRPDAPRWSRTLTGAAVIVSCALLLLCGYAWWQASGMVASGDGLTQG